MYRGRLPEFRFWLVRGIAATFGVCSIVWALCSVPIFSREDQLADSAQRIMHGESYQAEGLKRLKSQVDSVRSKWIRPSSLRNVAIVLLRLVEVDLETSDHPEAAASLMNLEAAVTAALADAPADSFQWLMEYWLQTERGRSHEDSIKFLHLSYATGPNEAWIAIRRQPLALRVFSSLSQAAQDQVLAEFDGFVRSELYEAAADLLTGPGWSLRAKLLGSLVHTSLSNRRAFAKVLESKDLENVSVPGVELDGRPSRPF